jgi:hypothetical protein
MTTISESPTPTRIEFLKFDDWKRFADAHGFWMDRPATRPGYYSMVNGYEPLHPDLPMPRDFSFDIVPL